MVEPAAIGKSLGMPKANVADLMDEQSANLVEAESFDVVWINQQDDSVSRGGANLLCLDEPQASATIAGSVLISILVRAISALFICDFPCVVWLAVFACLS